MSESRKGSGNYLFGKKHTPEMKRKFSEAATMQQNFSKRKNCTSSYFGVCFIKDRNVWRAQITFNKKHYILGNHKLEIDAARAYDKKAFKLYGNKANLNFPEEYKQ